MIFFIFIEDRVRVTKLITLSLQNICAAACPVC